jgi:membrane-bound lytic murein transglycosylase D
MPMCVQTRSLWSTVGRGVAPSLVLVLIALGVVLLSAAGEGLSKPAWATNADADPTCVRYSIPKKLLEGFNFVGEKIPLERKDVRERITSHLNFLLLDARGALTGWLVEKDRYAWIFEEILKKEGIPKEAVLLAPILSGLNVMAPPRGAGAGWWALVSPCTEAEGVEMSADAWHDDRLDLETSTRCFAGRLKEAKKELGARSWLMATAAYLTSAKTLQEYEQRWATNVYWDIPLPDAVEDLVVRWIALSIIDDNRAEYGLRFKNGSAMTFDQLSGLVLAKDLPVAEIAQITGLSAREILRLNPKIKPSQPIFPAEMKGKKISHTLAAPRGKGKMLVEKLQQRGYLSGNGKH